MVWQYSERDPLTWASTAGIIKKIAIFDQYYPLFRKRYKIGLKLLWKANRKQHQSFRVYQLE